MQSQLIKVLFIASRPAVIVLLAVSLASCGRSADESADVGYDDGFAVGYNTTCKIRATMIEGDFDNKAYKEAYDDGFAAGARECREKGQ